MGFRFKNFWRLWLTVVLIACFLVRASAQQITVQVHNRAAMSPSVLRLGEAEAGRILADAGIAVVWLNCPNSSSVASACLGFHESNEFVLRIVSEGRTLTDSVFGEAFLGEGGVGQYCDIFFSRIQQAQRDSGTNPALLLGAVAAHELGHLLLGSHAHSLSGIMEPVWQQGTLRAIGMGTLLFNPQQAAMMRAHLATPAAGSTAAGSALTKPGNPSQLFLRLRFLE